MALSVGIRVGAYEVTSRIGEGGMGEVYRAHDTQLNRDVALKILPEAFASDADRIARFTREAQALAALNHPHIAQIHGLEHSEGTRALVMEFVEGDDLARRVAAGPLPPDEAVPIALQIIDALEAAHARGIIHRDLKPANIKVRVDGTVKLLDFGLAKALSQPPESSDGSPTITSPAGLTLGGVILGTAAYMSPEQARGRELDKRTDIWAFGCVLYEMLSGRRAFDGESVTDTLAAVITRDPDWTALPDRVPEPIRLLLKRCLEKDRNARVPDIAVARFLITETAGPSTTVSPPRSRGGVAAGVVLTVAALALGAFAGWRFTSVGSAPAATIRFEVLPPAGVTLQPSPVASAAQLALSPDGSHLAFVAATRGGSSQIWLRRLDSTQAQTLAGTEGASFPFWSHDSRFVAFFAAGKLKTVDTRGGAPQTLADAAAGRGGTWSQDGVILFAGQASSPIFRVAASGGGAVTPATRFDSSQGIVTQYWPHFLPDGRHFLYYQRSGQPQDQGIFVASLDSPQGVRVIDSGTRAAYAAGHLLFVRDGILFAQPFDERTLRVSGEPSRVADGVGYWAGFAYGAFTASHSGAIAYGPSIVLTTSLRWRDRTGTTAEPALAPRPYTSPRLSPDETSIMVAITDVTTAQPDLWQMALSRGTISRVTTDPSSDWFPAWSPDGSRVFFGSARRGATLIFQKAGIASEEIVSDAFLGAATYPVDVSRDGSRLLFMQSTSHGYDLGVLSLNGDRTQETFVAGPFNEVQGRFSPNMRWIAYASDESGKFEVYVRSFPADSSRSTTISLGGGMQPEWRRDGKELLYVSADGKLTAVPVVTDAGAFTAGTPRPLFEVEVPEPTAPYPNHYALTGDGQRFLVNTVSEQPTRPALTVILNWAAQ